MWKTARWKMLEDLRRLINKKKDIYKSMYESELEVEDVVSPEKDNDEKNMNNHLLDAEFIKPLLCHSVRIGSFKVFPPANTSFININLSMDGLLFNVPMVTDKSKTVTILLKPCDITRMMVHFGRNLPVVFVFTTSSFAEALRKSLNMSDGDHAYFDPNSNDEKQKMITFLVDRMNCLHQHYLQHDFLPKRKVVKLDRRTANEILMKSTPNQINFAQNHQLYHQASTNTKSLLVESITEKNVHFQKQVDEAVIPTSVPVNKMHLWESAKVQPQNVAENQATTITRLSHVQFGHVMRILREERDKNIATSFPKIAETFSIGVPLVESGHVKSTHCQEQVKNIAIPPLKITETVATTKSPIMKFDYLNNIHFLEQANSPITQSSVPVNKMHLWDWTRMSKNVKEDESNNLIAQVWPQNVAETEHFQMNCLKHFHKNFKHAGKYQNSSHGQLKSVTALVQRDVDGLLKNNLEYLTDSSKQIENLEHLKKDCEKQLSFSTTEVHPKKNESVHIKMKYVTEPSKQFKNVEQFKNGCERQSSSLVTGVLPEKDDPVQIKMEFVTEPSEQFESVEELKKGSEEQPSSSVTGVQPEKYETVHVKMEYTIDSSEQLESVEKLKNGCEGQPCSSITGVHPEKDENAQIKMGWKMLQFKLNTVQENSVMPNRIQTPPPEIIETSLVIKSPKNVFGNGKNHNFKKRGRKPGIKKPTKKKNLWEWAERIKNVRGNQPNYLRAQAQQENAAKTNNLKVQALQQNAAKRNNLRAQAQQQNVTKTVKIQINSLKHFGKQFQQMQKFKNGCKNLLQTITPEIQPEQNETAQIKMEYLIDSSIQNENVEKFYNGCEEQTDSTTVGVHSVKDETVPIKMEHPTNSSEQLENIGKLSHIGHQLSNSTAAVWLEKDETVLTTMEYFMDSSEEMRKVEMLNGYESQPKLLPEKDQNVQIKMEFAVDSSEQIENIKPWNMLTSALSTPNVNIKTQNDLLVPISVNGSVSDTWNPPDTNYNAPAFYSVANISEMRYSAELKEVEKLNVCGAGEQLNSSKAAVLQEKNGNMQIKLESVDEYSI